MSLRSIDGPFLGAIWFDRLTTNGGTSSPVRPELVEGHSESSAASRSPPIHRDATLAEAQLHEGSELVEPVLPVLLPLQGPDVHIVYAVFGEQVFRLLDVVGRVDRLDVLGPALVGVVGASPLVLVPLPAQDRRHPGTRRNASEGPSDVVAAAVEGLQHGRVWAGLSAYQLYGAVLDAVLSADPGQSVERGVVVEEVALAGGGEIEDAGPLENGLSIRLRIPYSKCLVSDLRLNGYPLPPSESDGFVEWVARGYKYVQINVPPEKAKAQDLFVVTCEYDPQEKRERWQGWK